MCHCGHHQDTHYLSKNACLGVHCECDEYLDENEPKPRQQIRVAQPVHVDDAWDADPYPSTAPMWPVAPVYKP